MLDARLDRWTSFLLIAARLMALLLACGAGWWLARRADMTKPAFSVSAVGLIALWLMAGVAIWRATSPDTRRELASLALCASVGWVTGALWSAS